jgi:hypothetical protein
MTMPDRIRITLEPDDRAALDKAKVAASKLAGFEIDDATFTIAAVRMAAKRMAGVEK